jgi:hypothetical protein
MKKQAKKLVLAKETVRNLTEPEITKAAGATNTVCWSELSCTESPRFCGLQNTTNC